MKKYRTMVSAGNLENLVKAYNKWKYSTKWIAKKDEKGILRLYNTELKMFSSGIIKITKKRAKYVIGGNKMKTYWETLAEIWD